MFGFGEENQELVVYHRYYRELEYLEKRSLDR
jgi:hypothetical protein